MKLRNIEAILLYGHFYLKHTFVNGVNIVYGDNGGGKTTLLNILTNALNGNFNRFVFLEFSMINIEFDDGKILSITRNPPDIYDDETINVSIDDELIVYIPISEITADAEVLEKKYTEIEKYELPQILYFPAYRILYDYVKIASSEVFNLLSGFSPSLYFPQLIEIEERLKKESLLGNISPETDSFVENINKFYSNKKLKLNEGSESRPFEILYEDGHKSKQLTTLSSGERQITTIIYAVSQAQQNRIVLIDEPEISLHVGWQRKILKTIETMFRTEQIIACTHSPVIGADYELAELEFRFVGNYGTRELGN
jgi:predicted ATP-binding protein involved in virulence